MRVLVLGHSSAYADYAEENGVVLFNVLDAHGLRLENLRLQSDPIAVADRTSIAEILSALHRRGIHRDIDAVFTNSEAGMITAAALAELLGARGIPVRAAVAARDKGFQKALIRAAGIPVTPSAVLESNHSPVDGIDDLGFPAVVKPLASAGTYGVTRVRDREHLSEVLRAYREVHRSVPGPWLVEEFVDGVEFHLDGIVRNGVVEFLSVGRYVRNMLELRNGNLVGSMIMDPGAHPDLYSRYHRFAEASLGALGLTSTVFHLELFESSEGTFFSECAARCGGGRILPCIAHRFGIELESTAFKVAVMDDFSPPGPHGDGYVAWSELPVPTGHVTRLPDMKRIRSMPGVVDVDLGIAIGDRVPDRRTVLNVDAGCAVVHGATEEETQTRIDDIAAAFAANIEAVPC
ncbi:ATP-grasp domain-containing protein [Streptosporangium sp. NBC_01755]|uniref:ATP-grasp domain-containing protein n=1 Tax=unclassified Streptosporangium TaxID=2632669 RepID=UPI002DD9DEA7|nr:MULTISPECIES: ATP-grasp domain-containing protein [unclassified Streptosporangium]WSA26709.1 ATP-grasp domain-containing protein [Streptosporangium sp. NBC_01810]WSD01867.1 ATP-grasp domain-containing protein [Streptosporangium sp. NBC_01755]